MWSQSPIREEIACLLSIDRIWAGKQILYNEYDIYVYAYAYVYV